MRSAASYLAAAVLAGVLALPADAGARTWYVAADGTGDAPDISSAFDSTAVGDTILVGPGTFTLSFDNDVRPATTLISEDGPTRTRLVNDAGRAYTLSLGSGATLSGFWIYAAYPNGYIGGVAAYENVTVAYNVIDSYGSEGLLIYSGEVHHNLFIGMASSSVYAADDASDIYLHHNILLNGTDCSSSVFISWCNDILGEINCIADAGSSFSADPQFCGVDNYYLQSDSPCAPGNHPSGEPCGQIGPFPVGCGTVDTEEHSWGSVKSIYRE